jgi:hypothetical protein
VIPGNPSPIRVIRVGQWLNFLFSDQPITSDHQITPIFCTPPGIFSTFVANKGSSRNQPLGGACVTLGWPLRGPWVAQG